ncbi:MAG: carboxynorspermidine decarboxylase [Candidatus Thiodiazotropha sp.]
MTLNPQTGLNRGSESQPEEKGRWIEALTATPGFVFDERQLRKNLALLEEIRAASGCRVLYSIKACPFMGLLTRMRGRVDGFSVSSLFEARLAHEALAGAGSLHITTPGLRRDEMSEIGELCDFVNFNSLSQLERLPFLLGGRAEIGLRINPQLSFLDDPRYDPCRRHSKLGAPLPQVVAQWLSGRLATRGLKGVHLHTHFGSRSFAPLQQSVEHLEQHLAPWLRELEWVNLGGGYLFQAASDPETLLSTIDRIHTQWGAQVYLEPGSAVVEETGYLVASVLDTFESDGRAIAVLDTSVNHLPEVFEYQKSPELLDERTDGPYRTLLVGATCLSGDRFGDYSFSRPLEIGDRVVFKNVGAYSLIKASRFNGQNLPALHLLGEDGSLNPMKTYDYEDYRRQWSEDMPSRAGSKRGTGSAS